jgi:hypothetical protein
MPGRTNAAQLNFSNLASVVVLDGDYYRTRASQCFREARRADGDAARRLRNAGLEFEAKAREVGEKS